MEKEIGHLSSCAKLLEDPNLKISPFKIDCNSNISKTKKKFLKFRRLHLKQNVFLCLKAKSEEILEQLLLTSPCLQHSANGSLVSKYCSANYFTDGRRFWCNSKLYHNVVWFGMAVYHKINNIKDGQSGLSL